GEPLMVGYVSQAGGGEGAVCSQNGFQSLVILPLSSKDKAQGALFLASSKPDHFSFPEQRGLLAAVTHQIGIAIENARLYGEIQRREAARRQLLARVITAQEEERRRLARELHDESTQALTALIMSIQAAQDSLPEGLEKEKERLARTKAQAIHALVEMRQMILDLRPTALDDLGLVPAVRWYSETHLQPLGTQACVEMAGIKQRLPAEMEISLFRIFQEAINNIAKHSQARRATIRLDVRQEQVDCTVEDDGIGFDAGRYPAQHGPDTGLGLLGMQERVSLLGGSLTIESTPGKGTRLRVSIPLEGG
ncbi:MAG TPA: GAF domain-containing sensor histidine kinase, partial [Dehalococcoidia bacterium]|nr:GAF domain-containing sensor histidine kinase [Dehalococcoidia bacterium]